MNATEKAVEEMFRKWTVGNESASIKDFDPEKYEHLLQYRESGQELVKEDMKSIIDRIAPNKELIEKVEAIAIDETHEGFLEGHGTDDEVKLACADCVGILDRTVKIVKAEILSLLKGKEEA